MDYITNTNLQEVCNIKQPILFQLTIPEFLDKMNDIHLFDKHDNTEIKVWDVNDYYTKNTISHDYIVLPYKSAEGLFKSDTKGHYYTEQNQDFLEEMDIISEIRELDVYLKPRFTVNTKCEIIMGSDKCTTPLRYHTNYRKFMYITSGKISVKMSPWRSKKYLHSYNDYENYDFYSPINIWSPQKEYMNDMDKLRFLDFEVFSGFILYIPPYWWYSIRIDSVNTKIININYQTPMNICSNLPDIGRYYLQFHNTKRIPAIAIETKSSNEIDSL